MYVRLGNIFPNPTGQFLFSTLSLKDTYIQIWDVDGQTALKYIHSDTENKIDVSHIPTGLYFIQIQKGKKQYIKKISKNLMFDCLSDPIYLGLSGFNHHSIRRRTTLRLSSVYIPKFVDQLFFCVIRKYLGKYYSYLYGNKRKSLASKKIYFRE
ncbi:MAG: T9SS type A sorting domain-containing protein [Saprospiraceae bacterium]|nr:T9SS type A sorting domain-containing protein [Saprospiraceae bacterium]